MKEEYETLEKEKRRAEEDQIYSYQKKKGLAQVRQLYVCCNAATRL